MKNIIFVACIALACGLQAANSSTVKFSSVGGGDEFSGYEIQGCDKDKPDNCTPMIKPDSRGNAKISLEGEATSLDVKFFFQGEVVATLEAVQPNTKIKAMEGYAKYTKYPNEPRTEATWKIPRDIKVNRLKLKYIINSLKGLTESK